MSTTKNSIGDLYMQSVVAQIMVVGFSQFFKSSEKCSNYK